MYDKAQFEAAFQLVTAISHQMVKIDFNSMEQWVDKLLGQEALDDPERHEAMMHLKTVMRRFDEMQKVLVEHGIPVRDIQHYKDSHKQTEMTQPSGERNPSA
jgi:hypothetical protein